MPNLSARMSLRPRTFSTRPSNYWRTRITSPPGDVLKRLQRALPNPKPDYEGRLRIPGMKSLGQAARWLRSRFANGVLTLGYHRIAQVARDPYSTCVAPQHFEQHLAVLRQRACPISLGELVSGLERGKLPRRAVVLTFDDGYAETLSQAKPLLKHYQVPATVFVTTGYLGREFWWDELDRIVWSPAVLPACTTGGRRSVPSGPDAQRACRGTPPPRRDSSEPTSHMHVCGGAPEGPAASLSARHMRQ